MRSEECMGCCKCSKVDEQKTADSRLDKYRPTKHRKAYKFERNFKKRCYVR